jgi:hypothetical protein
VCIRVVSVYVVLCNPKKKRENIVSVTVGFIVGQTHFKFNKSIKFYGV